MALTVALLSNCCFDNLTVILFLFKPRARYSRWDWRLKYWIINVTLLTHEPYHKSGALKWNNCKLWPCRQMFWYCLFSVARRVCLNYCVVLYSNLPLSSLLHSEPLYGSSLTFHCGGWPCPSFTDNCFLTMFSFLPLKGGQSILYWMLIPCEFRSEAEWAGANYLLFFSWALLKNSIRVLNHRRYKKTWPSPCFFLGHNVVFSQLKGRHFPGLYLAEDLGDTKRIDSQSSAGWI